MTVRWRVGDLKDLGDVTVSVRKEKTWCLFISDVMMSLLCL